MPPIYPRDLGLTCAFIVGLAAQAPTAAVDQSDPIPAVEDVPTMRPSSASSSGDVAVRPGTGSLTLTGFAPTIRS
jgi:hypothetical protein